MSLFSLPFRLICFSLSLLVPAKVRGTIDRRQVSADTSYSDPETVAFYILLGSIARLRLAQSRLRKTEGSYNQPAFSSCAGSGCQTIDRRQDLAATTVHACVCRLCGLLVSVAGAQCRLRKPKASIIYTCSLCFPAAVMHPSTASAVIARFISQSCTDRPTLKGWVFEQAPPAGVRDPVRSVYVNFTPRAMLRLRSSCCVVAYRYAPAPPCGAPLPPSLPFSPPLPPLFTPLKPPTPR